MPIVAIDVSLPVTIASTVQSIHHIGICSYPVHLFIYKLAKISHIEYTTTTIKMSVRQVFSEAFKN